MGENHLVPNSFQHPNFLIDRLDYYLTPEESKVLSKAVREILGWRDKIVERKAPIALSIFVDGKFSKDGERLCYGCGLGLGTVRNVLAKLDEFGILVKVGQATQAGQTYWLQDDESQIDWDALKSRRTKWDKDNAERTQKATEKSLISRGVTSDVRGNVGRQGEVTSDVREGVTSDVNKETQSLETQSLETQGGEPPARDYLTDVFNGNVNLREGEKLIQQAEWGINDPEHRQAMAAFLEASRLPIPRTKTTRGNWLSCVGDHIHICGTEQLEELYPRIIAHMRGDGLTVSRPGSVTNNLADWWAQEQNGGKHAPNNRTGRVPGSVPKYSVADPAAFGEQLQDDDGPGDPSPAPPAGFPTASRATCAPTSRPAIPSSAT